MNKKDDNIPPVKTVYSQTEFDELYHHLLENNVDREMLLERELQNTKHVFDCLYNKEDTFWKQCNLQINPDYIVYACKSREPIKHVKVGFNVIYPNIMSTSRLEIHTKSLGKAGVFLYSIFKTFGYSAFTFNQIVVVLKKDYPQMPQERIMKTIKNCFRHLLFDLVLVLS